MLGNTKTPTLSALLMLCRKWMFISAAYSVWLLDLQNEHPTAILP